MKPMLCKKVELEFVKANKWTDWVIEPKYDGIRCYAESGKLYDRRGNEITHKFPEFDASKLPQGYVLDGEIIAQSGEFSDISGRVHLKDKLMMRISSKRNPAVFVVFDVVTAAALEDRRNLLKSLSLPEWSRLAEQYPATTFPERWDAVLDAGSEGLVLKHRRSLYQEGARSSDWLKVKAFVEVNVLFHKCEVQPKGVTLETGAGQRVVVNGAQAKEVLAEFNEKGYVLAEIQYLPQNNSEAWRFPSFRGLVVEATGGR